MFGYHMCGKANDYDDVNDDNDDRGATLTLGGFRNGGAAYGGSVVNVGAKKGNFSVPISSLIFYIIHKSFSIHWTKMKEARPWLRKVRIWLELVKVRGHVNRQSDG